MGAPTISGPVPTGGGTPIGGSGTTGTLAKFASSTTVGDSVLTEKAGAILTLTGSTPTATNGTYVNLACTGGTGTGATVDVVVSGGAVSSVTIRAQGNGYSVGDTLTCALLTGLSPAGATVATVATIVGEIETSANISTTGRVAVGNLNGGERLTVSATSGNDRIGLNVVGTLSTITFGSTNGTGGAIRTIANDRTSGLLSINYGTNPGPLSTALSIDSTGRLLVGQAGSAAAPVVTNATAVSGIYFPTANTVGVVANTAIAATFGATAGNGVALGATIGLIVDASGTQQGVKLRATPDNTNANTIDCYVDGGASAGGVSWTPTLSAAGTWGGTAPTVTNARYTRIGNMVFCTVTLDATASTAFSSTYGSSTITAPSGVSAAVFTSVPSNRAAVSANGAQSGTTIFVPTYASSTNVINLTWFYAV